MHAIFVRAVLAGASALAAIAVIGMFLTTLSGRWVEALVFAGGTIPPLWFLWRHRDLPRARIWHLGA